ncbi:NADH-quinone oxidoreductase subunit H [Striga asiatica]|uniref:NADH-quinone oxidoreductase subunit H n=1 Tax=Striga asiatica TaxID=4170 RepID=A0A5A7Q2C6_STRAF|nr:NADH-quinone oxidoreductase subunit H [Striga asiatica]
MLGWGKSWAKKVLFPGPFLGHLAAQEPRSQSQWPQDHHNEAVTQSQGKSFQSTMLPVRGRVFKNGWLKTCPDAEKEDLCPSKADKPTFGSINKISLGVPKPPSLFLAWPPMRIGCRAIMRSSGKKPKSSPRGDHLHRHTAAHQTGGKRKSACTQHNKA